MFFMNCQKYLKRVALFSIAVVAGICFLLVTGPSNNAYATYTSVTLSPSTGTIYSTNTAVAVYANSGSDEFVGIDINMAFTGSVDYVSATGAARCSSFNVTEGTGTVNIECLSLNHDPGETYNGLIGTLYFKSTAAGTSTFSITSTDPEVTTKTGGVYTLSTSSNTDLPDSGLFDDSLNKILIGVGFLLFGVIISRIPVKSFDFAGRVDEVKEEKLRKKRERWENKF